MIVQYTLGALGLQTISHGVTTEQVPITTQLHFTNHGYTHVLNTGTPVNPLRISHIIGYIHYLNASRARLERH